VGGSIARLTTSEVDQAGAAAERLAEEPGQAVSEANAELVLAAVDAYNAGDLDAVMEQCAPDIEVFPDASVFPEADPLRGRDEYRSWLEEANSAWISARNDTIEAFALGRDRAIHRGEWGGKGAASGIQTVSSVTSIYTIRGDLTARIEYYFDDEQALKAVGLSE
jgi:ketosteroid isomerase-like protein